MTDSYAQARFRAKVIERKPPPARAAYVRSPEQVAALLLGTVTMNEIRVAGQMLGLTFREAYAERARLYEARYGI